MAEIGMSRRVWPEAKHQLCWWHQREALKRRLKGNLPTSPYNVARAKHEYQIIDQDFRPYGQADPKDTEGSVPGEVIESGDIASAFAPTESDPNSIRIRIPIPTPTNETDASL